MIGDLRYKIPKGQTRDLLSKTARLNYEALKESVVNGSIAKRLKQGILVEVVKHPDLSPNKMLEVSQVAVSFPRQKKSAIVLDVAQLDEEFNEMILNEEDELLKELQNEDAMFDEMAGSPLVATGEGNDSKTKDSETED
jgi:predicted transcriptional regulator